MEILKYSNEQYAGMHGQNIDFRPGMNVILGDNETGKSTMITGLYDTLFMRTKLNKKTDKEFINSRFPTGGGNYIDGEVKLRLGGQEITVKKEWINDSKDASTVLVTDLGSRTKGIEAENKLQELLSHGAGVYDNIVFGRQSNEESILDWYYGFTSAGKTDESIMSAKQEMSAVLSAASGISEDEYLSKLDEKLDKLGALWDFTAQAPKNRRGIRDPYTKGVGEILGAYYNMERRRQELAEAKAGLAEYEDVKAQLHSLQKHKKELELKRQELQTQESSAALMGTKQALEDKLARLNDALKNWPELDKERANISALKQEDDERKARAKRNDLGNRIEEVKSLNQQRQVLMAQAAPLKDSEGDVRKCRQYLNDIERTQATLSGGKLHARIAMEPGYTAQLTMANGETVSIDTQAERDVDGFVQIIIPGVGKILVAPRDLDVPALEAGIAAAKSAIGVLLEKYSVTKLAELEEKTAEYTKLMKAIDAIDTQLVRISGGADLTCLEAELAGITVNENMSIREGLDEAISQALASCKENTLAERIAVTDSVIRGYEKEYASIPQLRDLAEAKKAELLEIGDKLKNLPSLPLTIEEFNAEKSQVEKELTAIGTKIEDLNRRLGAKEEAADAIDLAAIESEIAEFECEFERQKHLHSLYTRIKEDFLRLKEAQGDQFQTFYEQLNEYLDIVTGGQVRLEDGAILKSGANALSRKELLSRGTKQTILLAFRLALLKFYYQDEPGVIVLDDTLLDMDPGRRENSVKLLQEFSKDNQVIFTTCDPAIADMLGGNLIRFAQ